MKKYFAFMKHPVTGKEAVTQSWNNQAITEWIESHVKLGYLLTKRG